MATANVYATSDAHVQYTSDGKGGYFYTRYDSSSLVSNSEVRIYIRFDLASYANITAAALYLYPTINNTQPSVNQSAGEIDPETGDAATVYNNAAGTAIGTFPSGTSAYKSLDVTTYAAAHAGGYCDFGLTLTSGTFTCTSSEGTNPPYLAITYTEGGSGTVLVPLLKSIYIGGGIRA